MIDAERARKVALALARELAGAAANERNFGGLPDSFWGYYARGHDEAGAFGAFVAYSEDPAEIDELISFYEKWVARRRAQR